MMEAQHGRHTVRSHGLKLARVHLHDWLILLLLGGIEFTLFITHPFYRFVGREMMDGLKYPRKNISIRFWVVPIFAVVFPILVFVAFYFRRRDIYDLHHSILGILFSVLITGVLTDGLKDVVGEPRPDFFWRCFPDGNDVYDRFGGVICHGKESDIKDGHKSFPSGHTSWSFAGLGFLSLYLSGKIKAFDHRGHVAKLCIVILPLLVASYVGISVVNDYYHHWRDVIGRGLLGLVVTIICYLQFFPPPYHSNGWGPWAYFQMLERLRCFSTLPADGTSVVDIEVTQEVLAMQPQENEQNEIENNGLGGFSRGNNEAGRIEDIECGRR